MPKEEIKKGISVCSSEFKIKALSLWSEDFQGRAGDKIWLVVKER